MVETHMERDSRGCLFGWPLNEPWPGVACNTVTLLWMMVVVYTYSWDHCKLHTQTSTVTVCVVSVWLPWFLVVLGSVVVNSVQVW